MKISLILVLSLVFWGCFSAPVEETSEPAAQEGAEAEQQTEQTISQVAKAQMASTPDPGKLVWSYQGVLGPDNWGDLSPDYKLCKTGKWQSPIHLIWSRPQARKNISFNYKHSSMYMANNGHTIEITVDPGNTAKLHGEEYELKRIHFHSSSEHSLSGNILPMEVQYFHQNTKGETAVVSFFAIEGQEHGLVSELWQYLSSDKNKSVQLKKLINPISLLPKKFHHYHYTGSLTTPPCTEGVKWFVLNTPVTFSKAQILEFRRYYSVNNRPIQPLNGRKVLNY